MTTHTDTKTTILTEVITSYALQGYEKLSMRTLADKVNVSPSVLYHHFSDKDDLLYQMYAYANKTLGEERAQLKEITSARKRLEQIIEFQLDHAEFVVAVLKYYFAYRHEFAKRYRALPPKATLHIEEVLEYGVATGVYKKESIGDAKVIAHIINGFLLEYYPNIPKRLERRRLIRQIADFVEKAISAPSSTK